MSLTPGVESISYIVFVTAWVCPAITLPVFILRIYSALRIIKRWHWDDTFMVLAAFFAVANSTVDTLQVNNGLGRHIVDVPLESLENYFMLSITGATTTYNLAVMCTKSSILLYYLRFPAGWAFRAVTYCVWIVSVGYTMSGLLSFAYSCTPIEKSWIKSLDGTCIDTTAGLLARAIFNVVTDVAILLLPIWLLWPLKLWTVWQRISATVVLMAGGFVCVASCLRLAAFWTDKGVTETDHTWHYVKNSNWCLLEIWAGVFCSCLPSLRCFFVHHFPSIFVSRRNNRNHMSVWKMVRIPVTSDESTNPTDSGLSGAWKLATRIRKKTCSRTTDPDLEAAQPKKGGDKPGTDAETAAQRSQDPPTHKICPSDTSSRADHDPY